MIKALWFFVKITVFVSAAIWLISQPGEMDFNFLNYDVKVKTGIFLLALAGVAFVVSCVLELLRAVLSVPKSLVEYRDDRRHQTGYKSLTRGLVAVAAGDAVKATQYSKQTNKLLKDNSGLPLLLEAQAARLRGEEAVAQNRFEALLDDKDTAFLGIRGLMKSALDEGNKALALKHARAALKLHPRQGWILKMVYNLESQNHNWAEVLKIGKRAVKAGAVSLDKIISDRIAIHLMRHDEFDAQSNENMALKELRAAYKLNPAFVPTIERFSAYYIEHKKLKKAATLVEQAWKVNPHPALADIWDKLSPRGKKDDDTKILAWFERLVDFNVESADGHIAAAKAAIDIGYWGEAKAYLMAAEKIYPMAKTFHMRAVVEQKITHNDGDAESVLERSSNALPEKVWTCRETGMVYEEWSAIAMPHESFNTIIWDVPHARVMTDNALALDSTSLLIDPAA